MADLFDPIRVGDLDLPNRIWMAPLTRCRAGEGRVPVPLMAEYYVQRASAGLILTEATSVSAMGVGYPNTPGIWSAEQVQGWKSVTNAVHQAGGHIFLQLWHVGRISDPLYLDGKTPVAPSAVQPAGHVSLVRPEKPFVTPRALETHEITGVIEEFRQGARNALEAGFDGVELHAANGYLIDQFLQDKTNLRTDEYGGPIENRARLLLETIDAITSVWGNNRVGVHLAPRGDAHDMGDSNLKQTFLYAASELGRRKLAFICAREGLGPDRLGPLIKQAFGGIFVANESFDQDTGNQVLASEEADAVAYGKLFISNPDLPRRFREKLALTPPDAQTFYGSGPKGYTDYPLAEI